MSNIDTVATANLLPTNVVALDPPASTRIRHLVKRNGSPFWQFMRKLNAEQRTLLGIKVVWESTGVRIDLDPTGELKAAEQIDILNRALEKKIAGFKAGEAAAATAQYDADVDYCRKKGVDWRPVAELATDVKETVGRFEALERSIAIIAQAMAAGQPIPAEHANAVRAGLGGAAKVTIALSAVVDAVLGWVAGDHAAMSFQQKHRWESTMRGACGRFIKVVGDKDITAVTRADLEKFAAWWKKRVAPDDPTAKRWSKESANKDMTYLRSLFTITAQNNGAWGINVTVLFAAGLRFKRRKNGTNVERKRQPFSNDFLIASLLKPDVFNRLNPQARRILFIMIETGLRPSEIVSLRRHHVNNHYTEQPELDGPVIKGDILYVAIDAVDAKGAVVRELKTDNSLRHMPLVGISRAAIEAQIADLDAGLFAKDFLPTRRNKPKKNGKARPVAPPDALFPRYFDNADLWSACVSKFMEENGLRENAKTVAYSLRHSFEDRMEAIEAPDKMRDMMMGHTRAEGLNYGNGAALMQKHRWLKRNMLPWAPVPV